MGLEALGIKDAMTAYTYLFENFFTEVGIKTLTAGVVTLMSCCNGTAVVEAIKLASIFKIFYLIIDELQKLLEDV